MTRPWPRRRRPAASTPAPSVLRRLIKYYIISRHRVRRAAGPAPCPAGRGPRAQRRACVGRRRHCQARARRSRQGPAPESRPARCRAIGAADTADEPAAAAARLKFFERFSLRVGRQVDEGRGRGLVVVYDEIFSVTHTRARARAAHTRTMAALASDCGVSPPSRTRADAALASDAHAHARPLRRRCPISNSALASFSTSLVTAAV